MARRLLLCAYTLVIVLGLVAVCGSVINLCVTDKDDAFAYDISKTIKESTYAKLSAASQVKGGTVFLGDSITEYCDLEKYYSNAVFNRGISGDYTARMLARVGSNVNALVPKNVVLLVGTNDLGLGIEIDEIVYNVDKIIDKLKNVDNVSIIIRAVYPVNNTITPFAKKMVGKRDNADIKNLNKQLQALAAAQGCFWVDYTAELMDDTGRLKAEYTADGLHINDKAYKISAKHIKGFL